MGVWSTGPFGSDGALDYLGGLADKHATVGPDYTIVPGSVDHGAVLADLTSALAAITEPAKTPEEEYRPATIEYAYAAAGLVAAVAAGHTADEQCGTSLLAGTNPVDPLGLSNHCGYVALLRPEDAAGLREAAVTAVNSIATEEDWLSSWFRSDRIRGRLTLLARALSA